MNGNQTKSLKEYIKTNKCKKYNLNDMKNFFNHNSLTVFEKEDVVKNLFKIFNFKESNLKNRNLREAFFSDLKQFFNDETLSGIIDSNLEIIRYIEEALDIIISQREGYAFFENDNSYIIGFLIANYSKHLFEMKFDLMQLVKNGFNLKEIETKGKIIDDYSSKISDVITLNLKHLGHTKGLFKPFPQLMKTNNKKVKEDISILELDFVKSFIDDDFPENDEALAFCGENANFWLFYENRYKEWFFLDSEIELLKLEEIKNKLDKEMYDNFKQVSDTIFTYSESLLKPYALIAQNRIQRKIHNNTLELNQKNFPLTFIQKVVLCDMLHLNLDMKFGDLTIDEWLDCFNLMQQEAILNFNNNIAYRFYSRKEFEDIFKNKNLSKNSINYFIDCLSFKSNSIDIFDAPLIRCSKNNLIFLSLFWTDINLINIFMSITSKNFIETDLKGKEFEKDVLALFQNNTKYGLKFETFNFSKKGEDYQYDAIVVWEEYIFIFEVKNRSISNCRTSNLINLDSKLEDYLNQTLRLKKAFIENIEIFNKKFDEDLSKKNIVSIVLNALPFSLDFEYENVYFIDFSLLSKFFNQKNIGKRNLKTGEIVEISHSQWKSDKPTAKDLFNAIEYPFQLIDQLKYLKNKRVFTVVGNKIALTNNLVIQDYHSLF